MYLLLLDDKKPSFLLMLFSVFLTACGGGGTSTSQGNSAPVAMVQFPPVNSLTDQASIELRGTAEDLEGDEITSVTVNGIAVETNDGFANWRITLPLELGSNTLAVETRDDQGHVDSEAAEVMIQARALPFITFPGESGLAVDHANNRVLVATSILHDALFAFDLVTGERTVISSEKALDNFNHQAPVGSGIGLTLPRHLELDLENNRALVTESLQDQIVAIDINTGERTELLNLNTGGNGPDLRLLRSQVLDLANNRIFILEGFNGDMRLFAVDIPSGNRALIASSTRGSGQALNFAEPMALDLANNRMLLADFVGNIDGAGRGALLAVDLDSGNRTVISGFNRTTSSLVGGGTEFILPISLDFDPLNNRVLIAVRGFRSNFDTVFMVDLATGARSVVSGFNRDNDQIVGAGTNLTKIKGARLIDNNQAVAVDDSLETAVIIDLATGDRKLLPGNGIGNGPSFGNPRGMVAMGENLIVSDAQLNQLFKVDKITGDREVMVDGSDTLMNKPQVLALDEEGNRLLVIDNLDIAPRLLAIDLTDHAHTVISGDGFGTGVALIEPQDTALDSANNRLLVTDKSLQALVAIDLASGDRTLVSSDVSEGPSFEFPSTVVLAEGGTTALVADSQQSILYSVNLATGARTVVSGENPDTGEIVGPQSDLFSVVDMVLDRSNNRVVVISVAEGPLLQSVDLATGVVSELSSFGVGEGLPFLEPNNLLLDRDNRLLVLDESAGAIYSVDLTNGDRVRISWTDLSG